MPQYVLIQRSDLADGAYYSGHCRNAKVARWNAQKGVFFHWREKFGRIFIETIKHPADEEVWDVFRPWDRIENPPYEIPFDAEASFKGDKL